MDASLVVVVATAGAAVGVLATLLTVRDRKEWSRREGSTVLPPPAPPAVVIQALHGEPPAPGKRFTMRAEWRSDTVEDMKDEWALLREQGVDFAELWDGTECRGRIVRGHP